MAASRGGGWGLPALPAGRARQRTAQGAQTACRADLDPPITLPINTEWRVETRPTLAGIYPGPPHSRLRDALHITPTGAGAWKVMKVASRPVALFFRGRPVGASRANLDPPIMFAGQHGMAGQDPPYACCYGAVNRRSGSMVGNASVCRPGNAPGRTHALCHEPTYLELRRRLRWECSRRLINFRVQDQSRRSGRKDLRA